MHEFERLTYMLKLEVIYLSPRDLSTLSWGSGEWVHIIVFSSILLTKGNSDLKKYFKIRESCFLWLEYVLNIHYYSLSEKSFYIIYILSHWSWPWKIKSSRLELYDKKLYWFRLGFLNFGPADMWGCITLCWEGTVLCIKEHLAVAWLDASSTSTWDNQKCHQTMTKCALACKAIMVESHRSNH